MAEHWREWLERSIGVLFVLPGVVKFFGVFEDTELVFQAMARANSGTEIGPLSAWLSQNHDIIIVLVGLVMIITGLAQILRHPSSKLAAMVQVLMMICFVVFLHRAFPVVFFDGIFVLALAAVHLETRRAARGLT